MLEIDVNNLERVETEGHSSKGNQPKWYDGEFWYKADYMGYESLAEIIASRLLEHSEVSNFVMYEPILIHYNDKDYTGCRSRNFKADNEMLVPIEKLYRAYYGGSLAQKLASLGDVVDQIKFTVDFVSDITGLKDFGAYLAAMLGFDALILNEDRHTNNIAVIRNENTKVFRLCPIFDNGLSFLSDTNDYPVDKDIYSCISKVHAKPFSTDFIAQVEAADGLYGSHLKFALKRHNFDALFDDLHEYYSEEIIIRVKSVLLEQARKYSYMF